MSNATDNKATSEKHRETELSDTISSATSENRLTDAYKALSELATLQCDKPETLSLAGCVASALGKHTDATNWFSAARDLAPDEIDSHHNLGLSHIRRGAIVDAIKTYEQALDRGLRSADMLHDLAVAHLKQNDTDKAELYLNQALGIDPAHRLSQAGLLEICGMTNNVARATEYLKVWRNGEANDGELQKWQEALESGLLFGDESQIEKTTADVSEVCNQNIAIVASSASFLDDIKTHLGERNTIRTFSEGSLTELHKLLEWADVAWFDWCDHLLIQAAGHLPKLCPIICRLHSYEAFTDMPDQVEWSAIDEVVFVNESVRILLGNRLPESIRTTVIPNAVDVERYKISAKKKYGKRIASIGYINYKKNPQLLLYLFKMIHDWDPEFELHIAGEQQDPRLQLYMRDMARKLNIPITYHGWIEDMPAFLADKDFVVSTSLFESFHYSIAEGMASGVLPLVHDWFGSENVYPDEYRFVTPEEGLELVQRLMKADRAELGAKCRDYICERFALPTQMDAVDQTLIRALNSGRETLDKTKDYGLVSIVVPTFNRADLLPEAISSALKQTYPHCEIIVVNDGSTDNSSEILEQYAAEFPGRIKVIHQENKGVSAALNAAIRASSGEYISWLSSDDAYHPDKVWDEVRVLGEDRSLGWVYSDFYYITHDSQVQGRAGVEPLKNETFVEDMFKGNSIHGCSVMFRKSNLETTGYFDEKLGGKIGYGADGALWHKMGYHFKFEFVNKALVYYRLHPGQVTHQADIPTAHSEYERFMRAYFESEAQSTE